ncbi:MAG: DUF4364 family protein [Clostridia bacterium]|nr:DUF4364 family protein [Clostridia bacterium]
MKIDAFSAGIAPGGLRDIQEIKILICYIFDKLDIHLRKSDITAILQNYALANYFEVSQAFSQMVLNNNLSADPNNNNYYLITPSGKMISEELSDNLPLTVREKALKSAKQYLKRLKIEKENTVNIKKTPFGYTVNCKVSGGEFNMMEVKLYAPDITAATAIKNNFYKNPEKIYESIVSMLTDEI